MTLTINRTPVDFTLESEKTIEDLIASLSHWAKQEGQTILSLLVDSMAVTPAMHSRKLSQVKLVELETVTPQEHVEAQFDILSGFFDLVETALERRNLEVLADLHAEYTAVRHTLVTLLGPLQPKLQTAITTLDGAWSPEQGFVEAVRSVQSGIASFREEAAHPQLAFAAHLRRLDTTLAQLDTLSGLWQKGQDQQAMTVILTLVSTLDDLGRIAPRALAQTPAAVIWNDFQTEVRDFLLEVEQAMLAQDFVLLNDLIEYELAPRLSACRQKLSGEFNLDPSKHVL